jgi:NADPH:quinone reductase
MRAAFYSEIGGPIVVADVAEPRPQPEEVLVDMAYAALNPLDMTVWQGRTPMQPAMPHSPGIEGSGTIDGRPVLLFGQGLGIVRSGTLAQRIAVPQEAVLPVPQGLDLKQAAICGAAIATAIRVAELASVEAGDLVLVLGGSGYVARAVISILSENGARVIGQTRSGDKAYLIRHAGGEPIIAATPDELRERLADARPKVIIDSLGGDWIAASSAAAAIRGRIVNYATQAGVVSTVDLLLYYRKCLTLRGYSGLGEPTEHRRCIMAAMDLLANGRLKVAEPTVLELNDASRGFRMLAEGSTEKLVIALS